MTRLYLSLHFFMSTCNIFPATSFEATTSTMNKNIAQSILLSSSTSSSAAAANYLNPQAPIFVPTIYKQDFNSNFPPKSYADVVNADKDPNEQATELSIYPADDSTQ